MENQLVIKSFEELYDWLKQNYQAAPYVWVNAKRGKPNGVDFSYIDVVYCALCFGWIDATCKKIDGIPCQKIMPRSKNSHWSYLNIARCLYLMERGLMTDDGLKAMPQHYEDFVISKDILERLQADRTVWENFSHFPQLYQRIRIDNIEWARHKKNSWAKSESGTFESRLQKLIETSWQNKMYGEWNDYGRLA